MIKLWTMVHIRMPNDLYAKVRKLANADPDSIQHMTMTLVREAIEAREQKAATKSFTP